MIPLRVLLRVGLSILLLAFGVSSALFLSCGTTNRSVPSAPPAGDAGTVAVYLTDSMGDYQQVIATVNRVMVLNSGSGASCTIMSEPVTVDLAGLAGVLQFVNAADCPAGEYNRLRIEFARSVQLLNGAGMPSACSFASYRDDAGSKPDVLQCDPATDNCTLDINGAVNVLVRRATAIGLDFDLKKFDVEHFGDPASCAVTMKVSPLHASWLGQCALPRAVTGRVSGLDTGVRTFLLTKGNNTFTVDYSGIPETDLPGIDVLLQRAQDHGLPAKVMCPSIDFPSGGITATSIEVMTEGGVSGLVAAETTFTLTDRMNRQMVVFYGLPARVDGIIAEGAWVKVALYGYDGANDRFLAVRVEREDDTV